MKRHALFVGVDQYADGHIPNLSCAVSDATDLHGFFKYGAGYDQVELLSNPSSKKEVLGKVRSLTAGLGPGDFFLFFFAGHGFRVGENHVLVCSNDLYDDVKHADDGLPLGQLKRRLSGAFDSALLLAACQSDILATRGGAGIAERDLSLIHEVPSDRSGGALTIVTSCDAGQTAAELSERRHGLFTVAMLDLLREAQRARSRIDLSDAFRLSLGRRMAEIAARFGLPTEQRPRFSCTGDSCFILLDGVVPTASAPQPKPQLPPVVCPVCGKKNEPRETFKCRKCGRDNLCLRHQDESTFLCSECATAQRKAREEVERKQKVESTIKTKYDQLKRAGCPFGDPLETGIWRTPDGGWQCNYKNSEYDSKCAITLRPGDDEAYGVYGGIWEKWDAEGGVYNERKERGRLGYPISDEEPYYQTADRLSCFENGVIVWAKNKAHVVMVPGFIFAKFQGKYNELIKKEHSYKHLPIGSISQESDGSWQQRFGDWAAILLRPGDTEPHEVHGAIYKRWSEEGGASGHLGCPVSDEEIYSGDGDTEDRISHFEYGDIVWKAKESKIHVGRTITLNGDTKMELVWCPPGEFTMGSPTSEEGRYDGETQHRVRLTKGFWLGKYPVTQRQWRSVMGGNPSSFKGDDLPVEMVSWDDCQAFIKKVNAVLGCGARLPTEAEWEYACRAGTTTAYFWGNALNGDRANCAGNCPCGTDKKGPYLAKTTPVGRYGANAWGFADMHGNVCEWCADWYGDYNDDAVDPTGPASGAFRVYRGGSWRSNARYCRSANRVRIEPGFRFNSLGFRVALAPSH